MLTLVSVHIKLIYFLKLSPISMSMYSYQVFSALHIKKYDLCTRPSLSPLSSKKLPRRHRRSTHPFSQMQTQAAKMQPFKRWCALSFWLHHLGSHVPSAGVCPSYLSFPAAFPSQRLLLRFGSPPPVTVQCWYMLLLSKSSLFGSAKGCFASLVVVLCRSLVLIRCREVACFRLSLLCLVGARRPPVVFVVPLCLFFFVHSLCVLFRLGYRMLLGVCFVVLRRRFGCLDEMVVC